MPLNVISDFNTFQLCGFGSCYYPSWRIRFLLATLGWGNQSWELLLQGMMGKCLVSTSHSTQPRTCSYTMVVRALNPSGCPNLLLKPDTNSWKDKQQIRNTQQPGLSQVGPHNNRNGKFPQNPPPCQAVKEQDFSGFAFFCRLLRCLWNNIYIFSLKISYLIL